MGSWDRDETEQEMYTVYTANSIKVALPKSQTVNYERSRRDSLLLVFTSKRGFISLKQHQGTIANLLATKVILRLSGPE